MLLAGALAFAPSPVVAATCAAPQLPADFWPAPVPDVACRTLLVYTLDTAQQGAAALRLLPVPDPYGPGTLGYGMIRAVAAAAAALVQAGLALNADVLASNADDLHSAAAALAGVLFALSHADLLLSVPPSSQAAPAPWTLWRRLPHGAAQVVYAAHFAPATPLTAATYAAFLQAALGYNGQIVAEGGDDYLVRLSGSERLPLRSQAFGLTDTERQLRVADAGQRRGLGFLRLIRAYPGWGVFHRMSSAVAQPWPRATKLLIGPPP